MIVSVIYFTVIGMKKKKKFLKLPIFQDEI